MAKPPRRPRSIARSSEPVPVASRLLIPRPADPRQADLFEVPFIPPCKPRLVGKVPEDDLWQYEIKADGYRAQCHVLDGRARIYSKRGNDITQSLTAIVHDLQVLASARP